MFAPSAISLYRFGSCYDAHGLLALFHPYERNHAQKHSFNLPSKKKSFKLNSVNYNIISSSEIILCIDWISRTECIPRSIFQLIFRECVFHPSMLNRFQLVIVGCFFHLISYEECFFLLSSHPNPAFPLFPIACNGSTKPLVVLPRASPWKCRWDIR